MQNITVLPPIGLTTDWLAVEIPDNVRKGISFQLESLGVLHWSFDNGVTSFKAVGTGETLEGNFSLRIVYFKCDTGTDNLQLRTQELTY